MRKITRYPILILLPLYFILGYFSLNSKIIHHDESECHLPTTISFYEKDFYTALNSDDYLSASTPLPYILVAGIHKIFGHYPTIYSARLLNIIASLGAISLFWLLVSDKSIWAHSALIILFFYPYYVKPSVAYFMAIYGIFFYLLFVFFISKGGRVKYFAASISLTLAILAQQFYLIIVPFAYLFFLYDYYQFRNLKSSYLNLFYFSAPLMLLIPLFLIWDGLTHPGWSSWGVEFRIEYLTAVMIVIGSTLFPFTIFYLRTVDKKMLGLFFICSILLSIFATPVWVNAPTVGGISGFTFHTLDMVASTSVILALISKVTLLFIGFTSVFVLYRNHEGDSKFLFYLFLIFAFGFMINKLPSERHMIPLVVTQYLLVFQIIKKKLIYLIWLPIQIVLGSVYFYYIMFLYQNN